MTQPSDPHAPSEQPEPSQSVGTAVLEREELKSTDDGDADRFAHYVRKDRMDKAAGTGRPVVALCGKVWIPGRNPNDYPVCPTCKQVYEAMKSNNSGSGRGSGFGSGFGFPRLPFGGGR